MKTTKRTTKQKILDPEKKQIVIKLTMNEAEYLSIVRLSEHLDRPLASTIRELIKFSALTGRLGTDCMQKIEEAIGEKKLDKLLNTMSTDDQISFLKIRLFMMQLSSFSPIWDTNKMFVNK